jgi:dihydrofolate reductase
MCGDVAKIFIIGGEQVFTLGLDVATAIRLTLLDLEVDGDVYFPPFSEELFQEVSREHFPDARVPFTVVNYSRT